VHAHIRGGFVLTGASNESWIVDVRNFWRFDLKTSDITKAGSVIWRYHATAHCWPATDNKMNDLE